MPKQCIFDFTMDNFTMDEEKKWFKEFLKIQLEIAVDKKFGQ